MLNQYEIRLPYLAEFPMFFELTDEPKKLITELLKVAVYRDGIQVGQNIPLEDVVPLMTEISGRLFPKKED